MARPVLVLGFGPFLEIADNPAAALARAVDGAMAGLPVVGRVMTVSYARSLQETVDLVEELDPVLVLGVGVAANRTQVCVERIGRQAPRVGRPDVDGQQWLLSDSERLAPAELLATLDVQALARSVGGIVSDDAGRYVCNAWLYRVLHALGSTRPVGFVHLPPQGLAPERLLAGLETLVAAPPLL